MDEILSEFLAGTKSLLQEMLEILEQIDGDYAQYRRLEQYGQIVDRIMGAAKTMAEAGIEPSQMTLIGNYSELCKFVAYKGSQVGDNAGFYAIVVALLLDATEMLQDHVLKLEPSYKSTTENRLSETFLDRLRWVSKQFDETLRGSVGVTDAKLAQNEIDEVLRKLGISKN